MDDTPLSEKYILSMPDFDSAAKTLNEYRGRYAGRRCFVIGNGPSLKAADLDRIKENGDYSIASNLIFFIFDQTDWRPDVYTTVDVGGIKMYIPEMSAIKAELKLIPVDPDGGKMYPVEGALPIRLMFNANNWLATGELPPFSDNIAECVYHGQTITYTSLQIAVHLGFKEIIMIGMDHQYSNQSYLFRDKGVSVDGKEVKGDGTIIIFDDVKQNNFSPKYSKLPPKHMGYSINEVTLAYKAARKYAEGHGINIVNATRGGKLEVFDRVDFDEIMSPKSKNVPLSDLQIRTVEPDFDGAAEILKKYKNKYEGRRCFIIGNGPSLKAEDLDKIKGEFSIASHRIFLMFDKTEWRPDVYTAMDQAIIKVSVPEMSALKSELKLIALKPGDRMHDVNGALPLRMFYNSEHWIYRGVCPQFSDDISKGVENGLFVTYTNLQIAAYLGFKEIILMGMDHQYKLHWYIDKMIRSNPRSFYDFKDVPIVGRFVEVDGVTQNHFCTDYLGTNYNSAYCVEEATLAYMAARDYAKEHGIRILNATRGGKLDVFERVKFFDEMTLPEWDDSEAPEAKAEEQSQEIEMTFDLNDLDEKMNEMMKKMVLSLHPKPQDNPEIAALMEQRIDPPFDKTVEVLEPYRGKYKGERCFIVGNGPSLRTEDLEKIKGEFCIGSNQIYRMFDKTSWRPRVYTGVDENVFRDTFKEVSDLDVELKLCSLLETDKMYPIEGLLPLKLISKGDWIIYQRMPEFSDDITKCVYHATTISYINMQIAAFMGFDEVFLLGFDHQFPQHWKISPDVLKNPEKYVNSTTIPGGYYKMRGVENAEFYPGNYSGSAYCIEEVTRAYRKARLYFEEHGGRIVNSTRGGKLEVFERVNFDKLMSPKVYATGTIKKLEKKRSAKQDWMKKSGRR